VAGAFLILLQILVLVSRLASTAHVPFVPLFVRIAVGLANGVVVVQDVGEFSPFQEGEMNGLTALLFVMLLASIVFASASMSATSMISPAGGRASAIFAGWEKWALTPASSLRRVLAWAI